MRTDGNMERQTDGHDETKSRFSQLCEKRIKISVNHVKLYIQIFPFKISARNILRLPIKIWLSRRDPFVTLSSKFKVVGIYSSGNYVIKPSKISTGVFVTPMYWHLHG